MRVETYNSFSTSRMFSEKKSKDISSPDYNDFNFNTETPPEMSEEKYTAAIVEQAKKDAAADKFGVECSGFKSLMKSYVSVVSPDRKSIINNSLSNLDKIGHLPKVEAVSTLDILLGKRMPTADKINYAEFKDYNGETVATYSNGGWSFQSTSAEDARTSEFYGIYRDAWNAAKSEKENASVSKVTSNSIDVLV